MTPATVKRSSSNEREFANGTNGKKSVRFRSDVTLCSLNDAPWASDAQSSSEKTARWYGADDFDRFKRDAAADAGITIVRPTETSRRFVMMGDFDGRSPAAAGAFGGGAGGPDGTDSKKEARYNENEYDDAPDGDGAVTACRRGLGHHFSRARRRSRAVARAAVAAWQRSLLADDPAPAGTSGEANLPSAERTRLLLALVSARCSRTAREEARWRGDVDYRVAHPERHAGVEAPSTAKPTARAEGRDGGPAERAAGKRDGAAVVGASCDGAGRKRRRTGGGRRDAVDRGLSPAPVVFASGMLRIRAEA